MDETNVTDPYKNIPKGLNDEHLWNAFIRRIEDIDMTRRSIRSQLDLATANNENQKIRELKTESNMLAKERAALHNEMKLVKKRIKKSRRERNGQPPERLAIEFMLIAQKKLPKAVFADIRNEAAMNVVCYNS